MLRTGGGESPCEPLRGGASPCEPGPFASPNLSRTPNLCEPQGPRALTLKGDTPWSPPSPHPCHSCGNDCCHTPAGASLWEQFCEPLRARTLGGAGASLCEPLGCSCEPLRARAFREPLFASLSREPEPLRAPRAASPTPRPRGAGLRSWCCANLWQVRAWCGASLGQVRTLT